jgi:hypothetical protein
MNVLAPLCMAVLLTACGTPPTLNRLGAFAPACVFLCFVTATIAQPEAVQPEGVIQCSRSSL